MSKPTLPAALRAMRVPLSSNATYNRSLVFKAADEIERLRAELDAVREANQQLQADARRWRYIRRKLCLTGNGNGTCSMQAINLPCRIPGWPDGDVAKFCDAAIDSTLSPPEPENE